MMDKKFLPISLSLFLSAINLLPVLAQESSNTTSTTAAAPSELRDAIPSDKPADLPKDEAKATVPSIAKAKSAEDEDTQEKGSSKLKMPDLSKVPGRLTRFAVGATLGSPLAVIRVTKRETVSGANDLLGEHKNIVLVCAADAFSFPWAVISGGIEGVPSSVINSWKHSGDGHLSRVSLGLNPAKTTK